MTSNFSYWSFIVTKHYSDQNEDTSICEAMNHQYKNGMRIVSEVRPFNENVTNNLSLFNNQKNTEIFHKNLSKLWLKHVIFYNNISPKSNSQWILQTTMPNHLQWCSCVSVRKESHLLCCFRRRCVRKWRSAEKAFQTMATPWEKKRRSANRLWHIFIGICFPHESDRIKIITINVIKICDANHVFKRLHILCQRLCNSNICNFAKRFALCIVNIFEIVNFSI